MLDFQTWIERTFGKWTYRQIVVSIALVMLVIAVIEVVRIVTAAPVSLLPERPVAIKRWLSRDDSRSFVSLPAPRDARAHDGYFDVAWISGSPISIRNAPPEWRLDGKSNYEMTDVMAGYLQTMVGKPVRIHEFLLQGVRTGDMRRAVLFAAHQPEIDAYVVEVNSVWMLNEFLQFTLSRQRASILRMPGLTWFDYGVAARVLRAHEVGLELLGAAVPVVRDRFDFFGSLPIIKASPFPFRKPEAIAKDGGMIGAWQQWLFPEVLALPTPPESASMVNYRNIMLMSDLQRDSIGMQFFLANAKTLAETGKPAIMFMPPLNPKIKADPVAMAFVEKMTTALNDAFGQLDAANVSFHSETILARPEPLAFLDILHLSHGQGVVDLVVQLLEGRIGEPFVKRPVKEVYHPADTEASQ